MYFYPQAAQDIGGGNYQRSQKDCNSKVVDRELITGKNPALTNEVAPETLKSL